MTHYKGTLCHCQAIGGTLCYKESMIALEEIQERLRAAIRESGISHKEIAAKLGVNPSTVSKYLHQNKFPALDTFANLCLILDISSDEILGIK